MYLNEAYHFDSADYEKDGEAKPDEDQVNLKDLTRKQSKVKKYIAI